MRIKTIVDEDFVNYKEPSMYIGTAICDGKCCKEVGIPMSVCQNNEWRFAATVGMADESIIQRYLSNDITKSICFAGLEPFEQFDELVMFLRCLRQKYNCKDTVVIYTGYNKDEIINQINIIKEFENIIVKFGRFIPNQKRHYDDILGVYLASPNQYAEVIS